jgi:hypothetical protein
MNLRVTHFICAIAAVGFSSSSIAQVVNVSATNFTTGYFNTNSGWVRNAGIEGQNASNPIGERWQANDPYNPITELGETDVVTYYPGYTPGVSLLGNSSLLQGGMYTFDSIFPGTTDVRLWREFNPQFVGGGYSNQVVTFFAEWSLIGSLDGSFPNLDTFAFDLRTASDADSILRLQLTPGINAQPNSYTLQSIIDNGAGVGTLADLGYQAVFQIEASLYGSSYDLQLSQINPSTRAVITNYTLVTGGALTAGYNALDFATVSLDWDLTSTNSTNPGSNFIVVNDFTVSTTASLEVIPEASTWVVAGVLMLALGLKVYRRRSSPVATA